MLPRPAAAIRATGLALAIGLLAACSSDPPLADFGQLCHSDGDCASGLCERTSAGSPFSACTTSCSAAEPCPDAWRCGDEGFCTRPCTDGDTRGAGETIEICVDGDYVACSTLDDVASCESCGCDAFGGGTCVAGMGCVMPQPDGHACTIDVQCISGYCDRTTSVCGPRNAMGEPCSVDAECESRNCSTDGDETMVGHCNQALGTECEGSGVTDTCNECWRWDTVLPGMCVRTFCDPIDAPSCPHTGDRHWTCEESNDGRHRCYENCTSGGYRCLGSFAVCSDGFCQ